METLEQINQIFREALSIEPPPADTDLILTGTLDSLAIVSLVVELEERFSIKIPLETLELDTLRTPQRIAELVDENVCERGGSSVLEPEPSQTLVALRPGSSGLPVFLVHAAWGSALSMHPLAVALATTRPVYALQARGLDPDDEPQRTVEEMARTYVEAIREAQPTGPYTLGGYSFGGLVAFEMARLLAQLGDHVELLALIDPEAHHRSLPIATRCKFLLTMPLRYVHSQFTDPRSSRVRQYVTKLLARLFPGLPIDAPVQRREPPPQYQRVIRVADAASRAYRPGNYDGDAVLYLGEARGPRECDPLEVWSRKVRGRLEVQRIPGHHRALLSGSGLNAVADCLSASLSNSAGPREAGSPVVV